MERHWNGALLNSVSTVMEWTKSLVYKCKQTIVDLIDGVYAKGVKPSKETLSEIQRFITRYAELEKWDVTIDPEEGSS